jgi:dynein heavy chain
VLFINDSDIGWKPYMDTWLSKYKGEDRAKEDEKLTAHSSFVFFLNQYCNDNFLDDYHHRDKVAPICDMANMQSMTAIIDHEYEKLWQTKETMEYMKRLREEDEYIEKYKLIYEGIFAYAFMWAFGGIFTDEKISFSGQLKANCKVKFPENGQVFDFWFDPIAVEWQPWSDNVSAFNPETFDGIFSNLVVPTAETVRQTKILDIHLSTLKGVCYIGIAGTGKTTIIKNYMQSLNVEKTVNDAINFNAYTDSKSLQASIFSNVDRRTGKYYGPAGGKNLFFFIDDINMPSLDAYGQQPPICLLRQIIDTGIIFNRDHLEEQYKLLDIMFAACQNPKSGSFFVDLRMARHMTQIALGVPEKEILTTIYAQVLGSHFSTFDDKCQALGPKLVSATVLVFNALALSPQFAPTALKFHYQFNMRDCGKIVQNLMLSQPSIYKGNLKGLARMWAHECHRVWMDRLRFEEDKTAYMGFMKNGLRELAEFKEDEIFEDPNIFTSFITMCKGHDPAYKQVEEMDELKDVLEDKLAQYNEEVQSMELVLFNQAMEHICRISRIVFQPSGNALLVGVGGSGKQSLSKLTAYIHQYEIFRIVVASNYGVADLKTDIQTMFMRTGVQGFETLFLLTDSQIVDDKFLVYINDVLSSGYVPELFAKDELDGIYGKIRSEAKSMGYQDTPEELQTFFVNKVKKNLHLGLCFSPVGDAFRIRARMFPGLINGTTIDWFTSWPRDALIGVAQRFLSKIDFGYEDDNPENPIMNIVAEHMANAHLSIEAANEEFRERERRYNYTTPTSFLELINFYSTLLGKKQGFIVAQIERLEKGLYTMDNTTKQVDLLKDQLVIKMEQVEVEKKNTDILIDEVTREAAIADEEKEKAEIKAAETNVIATSAKQSMDAASEALTGAVPKMEAAKLAVDCLEVKAIQEFSGFNTPPSGTTDVAAAVQILFGIKDEKKRAWPAQQKMMKPPPAFIDQLKSYNKEEIQDWMKVEIKKLRAQDHFNYEAMLKKSSAAANLANWVINVVDYNEIYVNVKPLAEEADRAEKELNQKNAELKEVQDVVAELVAKVDALKAQLAEAEAKKQAVVDEAEDLQSRLGLANRLVNGLGDEYIRWTANVQSSKSDKVMMIGNALVSAAFVSYIGPFSSNFRVNLWKNIWLPDIAALKIPITEGVDPLFVLSSPAQQAMWATEGLPADRVSIENAAVVVSTSRYPLIIDPQL